MSELDPTTDPLYGLKAVAEMFGISVYTLRNEWMKNGKIKASKINGRWRIPRSEVRRVANEEHG